MTPEYSALKVVVSSLGLDILVLNTDLTGTAESKTQNLLYTPNM